jgi:hypothetical protein
MGFKPIYPGMVSRDLRERNAIERYFRTLREGLKSFSNNINVEGP